MTRVFSVDKGASDARRAPLKQVRAPLTKRRVPLKWTRAPLTRKRRHMTSAVMWIRVFYRKEGASEADERAFDAVEGDSDEENGDSEVEDDDS